MNYLVDTSALVRLVRRQVHPAWDDLVQRGLVAVCEPVLAETLLTADAKRHADTEEELLGTYLKVMVPDNIWDLTAVIRRELVPHGVHQALSVADLVVAATAIRLKLQVLHEDRDFEAIARFLPELRQHRLSAGPGGHPDL